MIPLTTALPRASSRTSSSSYASSSTWCTSDTSSSHSSNLPKPLPLSESGTKVLSNLRLIQQGDEASMALLLEARELVRQIKDPYAEVHFLEKLERSILAELAKKDPRIEQLLFQKDGVRMLFEGALQKLCDVSKQKKRPTCFVCFTIEEGIKDWLEHTFVPDLALAGVCPLFCFKDLNPGDDLNRFQCLIRTADLAAIICTPGLKKKCDERGDSPIGVAQEVRLARERYNDSDKKGTIYPIYLGELFASCPDPFFEPIFRTCLTFFEGSHDMQFLGYYGAAFELFGAMKGLRRYVSREIREDFLAQATAFLQGELDKEKIEAWRLSLTKRKESLEQSVENIVSAGMKAPLTHRFLSRMDSHSVRLRGPHPNFVGRDPLLEALKEALIAEEREQTSPTTVKVLTGPAGIGKKAIATVFGNLYLKHFSLVWSIRSETPGLFRQDYQDLARVLQVPIKDYPFERLRQEIHRVLEKGIGSKPWFIIFYGVQAPIELPARGGCVLITSRRKNVWVNPEAFLEVPPFSDEEAQNLFPEVPINQVAALNQELEGFPPMLESAAHYMRKTHLDVGEFIMLLKEEGAFAWESADQLLYPQALGKVYEQLLIELRKSNAEAFSFIGFCAYINHESISSRMIDDWVKETLQTVGVGQRTRSKGKIIGDLTELNLISYDSVTKSYSISRLLRAVVQGIITMEKNDHMYARAFYAIAKSVKAFNWRVAESWSIAEELFPHVLQLREHSRWEKMVAVERGKMFCSLGTWLVRCRENPHEGLTFLFEAERLFSKGSKELGECLNEIGAAFWGLSRAKEALDYFERSLQVRRETLGEYHLDTLSSYANVLLKERPKDLLRMEQELMGHLMRVGERGHSTRLGIGYHNMAVTLKELGKLEEATDTLNKGISHLSAYSDRPHPHIANSYLLLGSLLETSGKWESAAVALKKCLASRQKSCHENPCLIAMAHNHLGRFYYRKGKGYLNESLFHHTAALKIFQREKDPRASETCFYMADILTLRGKPGEALLMKKKGVTYWMHSSYGGFRYLKESDMGVGKALFELGEYQKALGHFQGTLSRCLRAHGESASSTLAARNYIAASLEKLDRHIEALEQYTTIFKHASLVEGWWDRRLVCACSSSSQEQEPPSW